MRTVARVITFDVFGFDASRAIVSSTKASLHMVDVPVRLTISVVVCTGYSELVVLASTTWATVLVEYAE
jgi:hypothetical protein